MVIYLAGETEEQEARLDEMTPRQIVAELDKHVVGQNAAKRAVAIALRNRVRRKKLPADLAADVIPKNIIMIGSTGVGNTEIARRLARMSNSPFLKVEASKFTEVGYVGRDVESMIRDLTEIAVEMTRQEKIEEIADKAELNAQKRAIETIGPGQVLVIEARGELGAGTIGDILALRALRRGATGIVTDGGLRDTPTVAGLDIPTYYATSHAGVLGIAHYPLDVGVPVACGGVLVMPGDVIVGDAEGAVVVPIALAEEVARDALDQEEREEFAAERVDAGESIRGLFPLAESRRAEFEAWRAQRRAQHADQEVHTP